MARVWQMKNGVWNPADNKFLVVRRDGTIPSWPNFVLGARDPIASMALRYYAQSAKFIGMGEDYADSVRELADVFDRHRVKNGPGDPPAGPHRTDAADIAAALGGADLDVYVKHDRSLADYLGTDR